MKSNLKIITIIVAGLCAALVVGLLLFNGKTKDHDELEIGVIAPLTGPIATNGNAFLKGLEMGVEDANKNSGIQLKLIIEDCHSNPKDAHSSYRKLKGQGVKFFVGFGGQFVESFASETNDSDEILFASATPNSNLLKMTNRCFRIFPSVDMINDKIVEYFDSRNAKRIAVIYMQFEAFSMYYENMLAKLQNTEKSVILAEGYDQGTRDFKAIISKLAETPVDIIYTASAGESSALLTRQLFNNPRTDSIPVVGDINFGNPDILKIIGDVKAPICAVVNYMEPDFAKSFIERNGQSADALALYGYITATIIKQSIDAIGNDLTTDNVYDYIKTHSFQTVAGTVSFDSVTTEPQLQLIFKETVPDE